jgi:hypothetical protein
VHSAPPELSRRKSYFTLGAVESARRQLRNLPEIDTEGLRSLVVDLFDVIRKKRDQRISWPKIHEAINQQAPIGLRTLQLYFGEEERERKRAEVKAAYAAIEKKRKSSVAWATILETLFPKSRLDVNSLKTYFAEEQRARKARAK